MRLNKWRIGVKTVIVAVFAGIMIVFEKLVHPVLSAQSAVAVLADAPESSAQMVAYGWFMPVGWAVVSIITLVFVYTEVRATMAANKSKEEDQ